MSGKFLTNTISIMSSFFPPGIVQAEGITLKLVDTGSKEVLECFIQNNKSQATLIRWVKYSDSFTPILIFQQMQHYPEFIKDGYAGRVRLVNQSSLELSNIRSSDEGLYECSITYTDGSGEEFTHVHLKVKGKVHIHLKVKGKVHIHLKVKSKVHIHFKFKGKEKSSWSYLSER
jgi:hypothetical protein